MLLQYHRPHPRSVAVHAPCFQAIMEPDPKLDGPGRGDFSFSPFHTNQSCWWRDRGDGCNGDRAHVLDRAASFPSLPASRAPISYSDVAARSESSPWRSWGKGVLSPLRITPFPPSPLTNGRNKTLPYDVAVGCSSCHLEVQPPGTGNHPPCIGACPRTKGAAMPQSMCGS